MNNFIGDLNRGRVIIEKIIPPETDNIFSDSLSAYKPVDSKRFESTVKRFIADGGEKETCPPESYIIEKYYFPHSIRMSNYIGFLLEQSGHFKEASILLRKVVEEKPDRAVAHLNLADSYWGMGVKNLARLSYRSYYNMMIETDHENKLPKRVIERKDQAP
ncbi:tetratricopeptide repeat protein [Pseudomonas aeruginosa]|uniref:tetratricopeptide repeat protein n=1 Tax=Pseudomonas aeruginosa TaxID=287 RepID=UPI003F344F29